MFISDNITNMESEAKIFKVQKVEKIVDSMESSELVECIKSLELKAVSIGEGGNAVIYGLIGTSFDKICLKKIKKKPQIVYNNIDQEHNFQIMTREAGVCTPLSLISLEIENEEYLIMERIDGYSVEEIIQKPDLIPKNFDYNAFCKSLDEQISKMHKKGLYHRDLHLRNIMINKEGLPVIIDFGTMTEGSGSDYTYEESVSMYNPETGRYNFVNGYFKDDLEMVKNVKSSLKQFMPMK